MTLPNGFLGTRGDILMDLVIVAFVVILPALIFSWKKARSRDYQTHKTTQLTLAIVLAVAVALFEVNLRLSGGIFELTKESAYAGSSLLNSTIYIHTIAAILTALIWVVLVVASLYKFDKPPRPNQFSSTHRFWGRLGMIGMIFTGVSAIPLYYLGFAL